MKKMILTALTLAMFATSSAFAAATRLDNTGAGEGTMEFLLEVESSYIYKLKNDKAEATASANDEGEDTLVDLGVITAGVFEAGASNDCADLVGLTAMSALGVSATLDAEIGVTPVAHAASCKVVKNGQDIDILMSIPLASAISQTGSDTWDVSYAFVDKNVGEEFNQKHLCQGASMDVSSLTDLAGLDCGADLVEELEKPNGSVQAHALLGARLSGAGAKALYSAEIQIDIVVTP